jgi:hypothetical protein
MESTFDLEAKEWLISEYNNYIINLEENRYKCKFCMTFINESYFEVIKHIHIKHFRDSFLIRFPKYRQLIKKINEPKQSIQSNDENNFSKSNNDNDLSDKSEHQINSNDNNLSNNSVERQESNDNNNGINDKIEDYLNSEKKSQHKSQSNKTEIIRDQINAYFNKVSKSGSKSKSKKKKKKLLKEIVGKKPETVNRIGFIKRIIRDNKPYYQCCWSGCQYESLTIDKCLLDHIKRHQKCDDLDIKKVKQSVQKKLNSVSGKKCDSDQIKGALNEVKIVKLMVRSDAKNSIIFND